MISPLSAVNPAMAGLAPANAAGTAASGDSGSFASELAGAVARVEQDSRTTGKLRDQLLRGEDVELHTVAIHAQQAQASFELLLQVRNKLIQGYQEIMRMQI